MKKFKLKNSELKKLVTKAGGCIATDRITVDGEKVGYMYREEPSNNVDSGWRFFAGDETDEYVNNAENLEIYDVNTICNYDESIMPYLNSDIGSSYEKIDGKFKEINK